VCPFSTTQTSDAQLADGHITFSAYDDKLELLAVMERLWEELKSCLPQDEVSTADLSLDNKVCMVVERLVTNLDSMMEDKQKHMGSLQLFNQLVHVLLNG
jgi:hypothetical protein